MDCFRTYNFLSHNPKRMIKFLLSFFVLSALFSLLPFILQSFKPFLMQFYTCYSVDKSYMFLLCNGLLVFIAIINSGPTNPPSKSTIQGAHQVPVGVNHQSTRLEFNASEVSATVAAEIVTAAEPPQEEEEYSLVIAEQENALSENVEEEKNCLVIIEEEEVVVVGNAMVIIDEHDAAEETEELNKKCEDFIRKMKAAFCSEPRADYSSLDLDNEKSSQVVLVH